MDYRCQHCENCTEKVERLKGFNKHSLICSAKENLTMATTNVNTTPNTAGTRVEWPWQNMRCTCKDFEWKKQYKFMDGFYI